MPVDVLVEEARTGRFMFGAGINSDAGVTGQITVDERNFDLFGFPRTLVGHLERRSVARCRAGVSLGSHARHSTCSGTW